MSDDDLRALERAITGPEDAEGRIRYARALERSGRRDEALDALLPARGDPRARSEIAKFPAWDASVTGAGGARYLDARPIRKNPRLSWVVEDPRHGIERVPEGMSAPYVVTPLAFITSYATQCTAIDPATSEILWAREASHTSDSIVRGEHLLSLEIEALEVRDIFTGDERARFAVGLGPGRLISLGEHLAVEGRGETAVLELKDPLGRPRELWRAPGRAFPAPPGELVLVTATPPRFERSLVRVVDLRTGAERSRLDTFRQGWVWFADEELVVLQGEDGYHAYERNGRLRWSVRETRIVFATRTERSVLTPDVGAGIGAGDARLLTIDRATGEVATLRRGRFARVAPVIARDVLHVVETRPSGAPAIAAFTLDGDPLWRLELPRLAGLQVTSLAVLHGGLVGVAHGAPGAGSWVFRIVGDP